MGLIYDRKVFTTPPDSFSLMWDKRFQGRVLMYAGSDHDFSLAAMVLGLENPLQIYDADFERVSHHIIALRRNVLMYYEKPQDASTLFMQNNIALLVANYGSQQVALLQNATADIGYVIPKESALAWLDCWSITRYVKNKALAEAWINYTLEAPVSRALTLRQGLPNTTLTRLPNRRLLLDRFKQAAASMAHSGKGAALLFIDLDKFKALNDSLGHEVGDQLLQQVAQRLIACVRESDTVSRLSGDEFVIILQNLDGEATVTATETEFIGAKVLASLNQPYQLSSHSYNIYPSIGAVLFDGSYRDVNELLKQADIAMYQAKKAGGNLLYFFDPDMQKTTMDRVHLEAELLHAITKKEQFQLYYQAQVDSFGWVIGAEALIRWISPERGIVSPIEFIPVAEESGLILPLGHWVMATACQQLASWAQQPETAHLTLAVNLSARQIRMPNFVDEVLALIDSTGVNPTKLKLEITESILLENLEDIIEKMTRLKDRGLNFSLDDFGTGYSSLQYLKRLPLDQLKIDQSFVRDLDDDSNDRAIVRTIIAMAKSLNLDVIAEGVETEAQLRRLKNKGCRQFQGYMFGRPVPIKEFDVALKQFSDCRLSLP